MKIIHLLLLIGFLSICSNQSPPPAPNANPTAAAVTKPPPKKEDLSEANTLLRISESLTSHTRLINGMNILAFLVEQHDEETVVHGTIGMFLHLNFSSIEALLKLNKNQAERYVNELEKLTANPTTVANALAEIQIISKFTEELSQMNSTKDVTDELFDIVDGWNKDLKGFDLTILETYKTMVEEMNLHTATPPPPATPKGGTVTNSGRHKRAPEEEVLAQNAADALEKFPAEAEKVIKQFKRLDGVQEFIDAFGLLKRKIDIYEKLQNVNVQAFAKLDHVSNLLKTAPSFKTAALVAQVLFELSTLPDPKPFLDHKLYKEDLDDDNFALLLSEEGNATVFRRIMLPLDGPATNIEPTVDRLRNAVKEPEMAQSIRQLKDLLTYLTGAAPFNSSLARVQSTMETSFKAELPKDFLEAYENITEALSIYHEVLNGLDAYLLNTNYKNLKSSVGQAPKVRNTGHEASSFNTAKADDGFTAAMGYFKDVYNKLKEFNGRIDDIRTKFKDHMGALRKSTKTAETWLKSIFDPAAQKLIQIQQNVSNIESGLQFFKLREDASDYKQFPTQSTVLLEHLHTIRTEIVAANKELRTKMDPSHEEYDYYKPLVELKNWYRIKEKLESGALLFEVFHKFWTDFEKFEKLFAAGEKLGLQIQKLPLSTENRYELVQKMRKFEQISSRGKELYAQVALRKSRYDGVPMEQLIELRWLCENLATVPNPGYRTQEWMDFVEDLNSHHKSIITTEFNKSLDVTYDLNFAALQLEVNQTYANYRAMVRYNDLMPDVERVLARSFYDKYCMYIELAIFFFATILFNVILYGGAIFKIRYDDRQEAKREKEEKYKHWEKRISKMNEHLAKEDN